MRQSNSLIVNGFPSQTSSASTTVWSQNIVRASVQVVVSSASLNGTFTLQGSNDIAEGNGGNPYSFAPTNWNTIGSSTTFVCSTTATNQCFILPTTEMSYEYIRLLYTAGNGGATNGLYNVRFKALGV